MGDKNFSRDFKTIEVKTYDLNYAHLINFNPAPQRFISKNFIQFNNFNFFKIQINKELDNAY